MQPFCLPKKEHGLVTFSILASFTVINLMANISDPTVLCCAADSPTTCGKQQPHCPADKMEIQPDSEQRYVAIWGQILTQETYNVHPTTITEQISCYHQTIRSTSPQSSNKSSFFCVKPDTSFLMANL